MITPAMAQKVLNTVASLSEYKGDVMTGERISSREWRISYDCGSCSTLHRWRVVTRPIEKQDQKDAAHVGVSRELHRDPGFIIQVTDAENEAVPGANGMRVGATNMTATESESMGDLIALALCDGYLVPELPDDATQQMLRSFTTMWHEFCEVAQAAIIALRPSPLPTNGGPYIH